MSSSSTLDPDNFPTENGRRSRAQAHPAPAFGPSDSSDSGSDLANSDAADDIESVDTDSDRSGTGEKSSAGNEQGLRVAGDIETDRIVDAEEAGLGGGLDQAEEAQLGVTDEELAAQRAKRRQRAEG